MTQTKAELLQTRHQGDIRLGDADSTNYVGFKAPATVGSNLVWTLPATDGSANQFLQTNASGVLGWGTADVSSAMPKAGGIFTGSVTFNDGIKSLFGSDADLEVYHDGTNAYIKNATGDILFKHGSEDLIALQDDGEVQLFHDGTQRLRTTSAGITITGAATISTNLTVTGDLTVSGTTTTINTQTLDVEDKNVVIGKVSSPSDTTADGGGWTLKGATDKTFNWVNATDAWTSSEHIHLIDNKKLFVGGASGTTDGLEIVHNGSNSILNDSGTGTLQLQLGGSTKLEIQSGGINVTGAINVNGAALSTAPTLTAVADGAIVANKAIGLTTAGKFKQIVEITTPKATPDSKSGLTSTTIETNAVLPAIAFNPDTASVSGSVANANGLSLVVYQDTGDGETMYAELVGSNGNSVSGGIITKVEVHGSTAGTPYNNCIYMGDNYWLVAWRNTGGGPVTARTVQFNGSGITMGQKVWVASGGNDGTCVGICRVSNTRAVGFFRPVSGSYSSHLIYTIMDFSGSGSSRTFSRTAMASLDNNMMNTSHPKAIVTNSGHIVVAYTRDYGSGQGRAVAGTISGSAGSGSISWGTNSPIATTANNVGIAYDSTNNVIAVRYKDGATSGMSNVAAAVIVHNTSTNALTISGHSSSGETMDDSQGESDMFCSNIGYFLLTYRDGTYQQVRGFTVSGTTITWKNETRCTNQNTQYPRCTYDSVSNVFVGCGQNTSNAIIGGINNIHDVASSGNSGNFLGFSAGAYSDGNTATVNTFGNTTTLSGLTTGSLHYVQNDGTINTSSSGAVCSVGTALSSTSLFIRDPS